MFILSIENKWLKRLGYAVLGLLIFSAFARADVLETARTQFKRGEYAQCLELANKALAEDDGEAPWAMLLLKSLMALGRYDEAAEKADYHVQNNFPLDLAFLKLAHTALLHNGQTKEADDLLQRIYRVVRIRWIESLRNPELVAAGRTLLHLGGDPRLILDEFYYRALTKDPNDRDAYLASGELALAKQDYALAAKQFGKGLARFGDDPDLHHGLAQAFYHSDRLAMMLSLDAALVVNPNHVPSLILLAEHHIEAESRDGATELLQRAELVNPWHAKAWALRAVIAHLENDPNEVRRCRNRALKFWPTNPEVDYTIGRKLSQNYRFAEGSAYQQQALKFDANFLLAQAQLAEDLLRLGDEAEGWKLAEALHEADPYSVTAFNLMNLRDKLAEYETLTDDGFVLRMDPREAAVYGDRVMLLLKQAKATLCPKYDVILVKPVTVELFVDQQDFAVRTFGVPGVDGFLGVCFGNVITANSPKLERPSNWEATLWHEFCHVVTLNMTQNKMPRWLSEGISVYEEIQENAQWGQRMTPTYRQMIEAGELTPISQLSSAFLSPPTPQHLLFAYYESALVVAFIVERFGFDSLKRVLGQLATGEAINPLLSRYTLPMEELDKQFEVYVRQRMRDMAPEMDWERPELESQVSSDSLDSEMVTRWLEKRPNNYWALSAHANQLMAQDQWEQAKQPLKRLIELYPADVGQNNAYQRLARIHRILEETEGEYEVLVQLAEQSSDAYESYYRLVELAVQRNNWEDVLKYGERCLAVYPLQGDVHAEMGHAHEELEQAVSAVDSYRRLLYLDPENPAEIHFRLARLLQGREPKVAKRHLLESLADAPRFREGHKLLLKMSKRSPSTNTKENDAPAAEGGTP